MISVKEKSRKVPPILESMETVARRGLPAWLVLDKDNFTGTVQAFPTREI